MTPLRRFYRTAFSTRNGAFTIACVTTAAFVFLGHDGRRAVQMLALAMPALLWLLYPIESRALRLVRVALVWGVVLCFMADGAGRAYLLDAYQATPDSSMVLGAIANTTQEESREFLEMYWRQAATWLIAIVGAGGLLGFTLLRHAQAPVLRRSAARLSAPDASSVAQGSGASRFSRVAITSVVAVMLLTSVVGYASKPWRRMHPVIFWAAWTESVTQLRADWGHQEGARRVALERALAQHPTLVDAGPSTVVLVISESINRDNLGMYGYARATTPGMSRQHEALGGNFLVMRNAWSVDATTVPGVRNILNVGGRDAGLTPASTTPASTTQASALQAGALQAGATDPGAAYAGTTHASHAPPNPSQAAPLHMIALARAAGYKVWWIGNQDDVAIENLHGKLADEMHLVNRVPGRGSASPDTAVLAPMKQALADPSPRKLLVIHLIGAHPHYRLRYPLHKNAFEHGADAVDAAMIAQGRPRWVRELREDYDSALLYHDAVVEQLLDMTRQGTPGKGYRAWMYLSDHGQEVGHTIDYAGHSQATAAGYRIPALIWQNTPRGTLPADVADRPFRADWADATLATLLGMRWAGYQPAHDVLSPSYQWQAPVLPAAIASFTH